jgi:hypothetical protein
MSVDSFQAPLGPRAASPCRRKTILPAATPRGSDLLFARVAELRAVIRK